MRTVRGKVVGNTVVLAEALPDGASVEVMIAAEGVVYRDDAGAEALSRAMSEAETDWDGLTAEAFSGMPTDFVAG
jgi:hypothetical protein